MLSADDGVPAPVSSAAVIGAGLMGRRIAGMMGRIGIEVRLYDSNALVLGEGLLVASQLAPQARLESAVDLADCVDGVDFVLEAVAEDVTIKREIFRQVADVNETAIIASNSSVIPIGVISELASDPSRCVGTHFWNPPDLIPIVEVIRGALTCEATMERTMQLMAAMGKLAVRVEKDVPGFVGNRLQHALWREAIDLVATGVCDAATVDLVVRNTIGLRLAQMGPLENADYVGLDLTLAIHEQVLPSINADRHASAYLRELVAQGRLGAKSGQGFLPWPEGRREVAAEQLAAHVAAQVDSARTTATRADAAGRPPTAVTEERTVQ